jgi:ADP-ribose pyrophosphatase YjhB (NUDIX family)
MRSGLVFSEKRVPTSFQHPVVGVGAVVLTDDGKVVLVRRKNEPLAGQWSLPGGGLELGESLEAGTAREVLEETGLVVDVGPMLDVFDRILLDEEAGVRFHFVLVDYLCRPRGGKLQAGSDVSEVMLADPAALRALHVVDKAQAVVALALERQREL